MKMIRAIVRPDKETEVIKSLEGAGFLSMTKYDVLGRGRQKGIKVAASSYEELPKVMLMLVVEDDRTHDAVAAIRSAAMTGHPGDGKIFLTDVEEAYTIRSGEAGL